MQELLLFAGAGKMYYKKKAWRFYEHLPTRELRRIKQGSGFR
jgi:hypothetical protein